MFPNKTSTDPKTTGCDPVEDDEKMRDNAPQDISSDNTPFHALGSPSHICQNQS